MNTSQRSAIDAIRKHLGVKRLDSRRLYLVNDGAYKWIGDRADLTAELARQFAFAHREGTRPDLVTQAERAEAKENWGEDWYSHACSQNSTIASTCGAGPVNLRDLPEDWQDGTALGPIAPL
jgi:hypothetical protein